MGVEETYWGIADELFLQDSPHLLKPVKLNKGGQLTVDMREKDNISEKQEKIGVFVIYKCSPK